MTPPLDIASPSCPDPGERSVQERPVLRERGQREVFCGLTSIIWLHRKLQDAFFLIVGSRTCAHLMQSAAGVMIFAEPRFGTAIIDDKDLAGLTDPFDELREIIDSIVARRPALKTVFLVGSCPSEVIKLDLSKIADRLNSDLAGQPRVLSYSGSGIETTFTDGEDACLNAIVSNIGSIQQTRATKKSLLVVGALADIVEDQFARHFGDLGIEHVSFIPSNATAEKAEFGPNTSFVLAQPFLRETARTLTDKGGKFIPAPFPFGLEGTRAWFKAIADEFDIPHKRVNDVLASAETRASKALANARSEFEGTRVFFFPDSQLEVPLARFLSRELGAEIIEIGTPYLHTEIMKPELDLLGTNILISEGQDVDAQLRRCRSAKPDLTVCGMGLGNPLEAEGLTTKWSIELVFSPIHGFDQALDLANLFLKPLRRQKRLALS
ncbi:MAG: ferredoxin:protochlorophyllide reductase (ATP-dependent) subunit N [Pseudomonadota bacterium]